MKWVSTKVRKAVAVLLVLVMFGSIVSPAVAVTAEGEAKVCQMSNLVGQELTEKEKKKAIANAFADKGVQKLRKELIKMGFKLRDIDATKVKIKEKEEILVTMFFEKGEDLAVLSYVSTGNVYTGLLVNGELKVIEHNSLTGQSTVIALIDVHEVRLDLCRIFCGGFFQASCSVACGLAGWAAPICIYVVCPILTYYVDKFGCQDGCEDLCSWAGF